MVEPSPFVALGPDFLNWLVKSRSENQISTLKLYEVVKDERNRVPFENNPALFVAAQELTAIAFSLWRAVFLNDLSNEFEKQSANLELFLKNLIAHNSIQYMTDFNSREWSFWYYLKNATNRLRYFSEEVMPGIVSDELIDKEGESAKERWENAQAALHRSIGEFERAVASKR